MQGPSFLAHQQALAEELGRGRSNAYPRFRLSAIPSDTRNCAMLDEVPSDPVAGCSPSSFRSKETPASVLIVLNLLAFAPHTGCDLIETA